MKKFLIIMFLSLATGLANAATIQFDAQEGSVSPASKQVAVNARFGTLPTPARPGHVFRGWFTSPDGKGLLVTSASILSPGTPESLTLFACWKIITCAVTFNANGGSFETDGSPSSSRAVTHAYGEPYLLPVENPKRTGYQFAGWYTEVTGGTQVTAATTMNETASHTLYARWNAVTYNVAFDAGIGSASNQMETYGDKYVLPAAPANAGYVFLGWHTQPNGGAKITANTTVMLLAGHTLYARWTPAVFDVTFDGNGGAPVLQSIPQNHGRRYVFPEPPTRANQTFLGWFTNRAGSGLPVAPSSIATEERTLYAKWAVKAAGNWPSAYVFADGSGTASLLPAHGQVVNGKPVTLTARPERDALFMEWVDSLGNVFGAASIRVAPENDTVYIARFRLRHECAPPWIVAVHPSVNNMAGVNFGMQIEVNDEAKPVKFTATKLPPGLTINAATGLISGVPTKPGSYLACVKVASVADPKMSVMEYIPIVIDALPWNAQGTFNGWLADEDDLIAGSLTVTLSPLGRITAKAVSTNGTSTFTAPAWSERMGQEWVEGWWQDVAVTNVVWDVEPPGYPGYWVGHWQTNIVYDVEPPGYPGYWEGHWETNYVYDAWVNETWVNPYLVRGASVLVPGHYANLADGVLTNSFWVEPKWIHDGDWVGHWMDEFWIPGYWVESHYQEGYWDGGYWSTNYVEGAWVAVNEPEPYWVEPHWTNVWVNPSYVEPKWVDAAYVPDRLVKKGWVGYWAGYHAGVWVEDFWVEIPLEGREEEVWVDDFWVDVPLESREEVIELNPIWVPGYWTGGDYFIANLANAKGQTLTLELDITKPWDDFQMTGTFNGVCNVYAQRNPSLNKNDPTRNAALNTLENFKGYYTFAFTPERIEGSTGDADNTPEGFGYLTATIGLNGSIKLSGKLANGTAVSGATTLLMYGDDAMISQFIPLYSSRGFVAGNMLVDESGALQSGAWHWLYPGKTSTGKMPAIEDRFALSLIPEGGRFGSLANLAEHYEGLIFHAADWEVALEANKTNVKLPAAKPPVFDTVAQAYVFTEANPHVATFTANAKTGLFSGKFNRYDFDANGKLKTISVPHAGVLLQSNGGYGGKGYFLINDTWKSNDTKPVIYPVKRSYPVWVD